MANNIVNNYCSSIIQMYQSVVVNYELNQNIIRQAEEETQDLLHELELGNPKNAREGYLIYKQLREVRQRRRLAKDENNLLQNMYDYFKTQQGQSFKKEIQKIQGNAAREYEQQEKRQYIPKQRSDLTITDRTCQVNRPFEELMKEFKQTKISVQNGKMRK
jgi:hypothetical protein